MNEFMQLYSDIIKKSEGNKLEWIDKLKKQGYKMAMPNDGWVNRSELHLQLAYPYFCGDLKIGDKAVLGDADNVDENKIIIISNIEKRMLGELRYHFKYV